MTTTTAADLLAVVPNATPALLGGDDPTTVLTAWLAGRTPPQAITDAVLDLDLDDRRLFLARWAEPWALVLLAHDRHPSLDDLVAFTLPRDDVILLAVPSGPPPPAILTVEADR